MIKAHSFHVPVMGLAFTVDTPIKIAQYGMDSVISIVDDILLEKMRKVYCNLYEIPYKEITNKIDDFRAKRITSYLNTINSLVEEKFEELKNTATEKSAEIKEYFNMLPDSSEIKLKFQELTAKNLNLNEIGSWLKENLSLGSIDVNIMTKLDKDNYRNGEKLPNEYNDAHAALRGFANSDLESSIVLSAGLNPRLYGYMEQFNDFYPDASGYIKKKIVLKVSDYRSALIQGKFLAKKGLWVSEYRVESGLNCGGHAFATEGFLLGPILAEFKENRNELIESVHEILANALSAKDRIVPSEALPIKLTAQGGVGTAEEHQFLIDHYDVDSVGWGTPFLLVPEAIIIDDTTLNKLIDAKEEDLYLSDNSPLGVPFNNLRNSTKNFEKLSLIEKGKPGSYCPEKYLSSNKEFTEKMICTASSQYQRLKIKELDESGVSGAEYESKYEKIVEKECLCVGLSEAAVLVNKIDEKYSVEGVSVCPGPNMAYFSKKMTLKEMVDHIYGRANMISRTDRPNIFIKELTIYLDYLKVKIEESKGTIVNGQAKYLQKFAKNLTDGISYYNGLFDGLKDKFKDSKSTILKELESSEKMLKSLIDKIKAGIQVS